MKNINSKLWSFLRKVPLPILDTACNIGAKVHYFLDTKHVKVAEDLASCVELNNIDIKRMIRSMYFHIWRILPDLVWSSQTKDDKLGENVEGLSEFHEYVRELNKETGIIFVSAHLGSWELTSQQICALEDVNRTISLYKPLSQEFLNRLVLAARLQHGQEVFPKEGGMLTLFKNLKRKGNVGLVVDQHAGVEGVDSYFLGRKCRSWDSAVVLAQRTGCPIISVALVREGKSFRFLWDKDIEFEYDEDGKVDITKSVIKIDSILSSYIMRYPDQWLWLTKRWGRQYREVMQLDL